ncbi:MAG: hypothetical protein RL085_888, partial [Actinomycetota bacterium]
QVDLRLARRVDDATGGKRLDDLLARVHARTGKRLEAG